MGLHYTRIRGALFNLGHAIGRNTIKRILLDAGIAPAPERGKRMSWSAFLRAHWGAIAAMDFFTVEARTLGGLVRYHVLFVLDLKSRRVEIAGVVHEPWTETHCSLTHCERCLRTAASRACDFPHAAQI